MNRINLIGRLVKDPELTYTAGGKAICRCTVAVDRMFKKEGEERQADFFKCTAFSKTAETISNYLSKGSKIGIDGILQNNNWIDDDGVKHYDNVIIINNITFCESKKERQNAPHPGSVPSEAIPYDDSNLPPWIIPAPVDDGCPF